MAFKEVSVEALAKELGLDPFEVREKHRLIEVIKKARRDQKISQADLGKRVGVTQGRIAQIESGLGTSRVTFEVLLFVLRELGYEYRIVARRVA